MGAALSFYSFLSDAVFPLLEYKLRKKGYDGFDERCGHYGDDKLAVLRSDPPLWVHAVSVGEVQAAAPFVRAARRDGYTGNILISTVTSTGKRMAEQQIGADMNVHVYAPWDSRRVVMRATSTFSPWAYVTMETEVWPNILTAMKRRRVPAFLVNARVSDRAMQKAHGVAKRFIRECYDLFTMIFAREEEDARRLRSIGVDGGKVVVVGDCKIDALLDRKERLSRAGDIDALENRLGCGGPIFIAGSTHEGEESIVLDAFTRVRQTVPDARLVLVPRHPERAAAIADVASRIAPTKRYTKLADDDDKNWNILLIDRIGLLFSLYPLAKSAFIGGSIVSRGGQNIMEPACWGIPVQHGPHMEDFATVTAELDAAGLSRKVTGASDLADAWLEAVEKGAENATALAAEFFSRRSGAARVAWREVLSHKDR